MNEDDKLRLIDRYGYWQTHPDFRISDWMYAVRQSETRMGYWDWVICQLEETRENTD